MPLLASTCAMVLRLRSEEPFCQPSLALHSVALREAAFELGRVLHSTRQGSDFQERIVGVTSTMHKIFKFSTICLIIYVTHLQAFPAFECS